MDEKITQPNAGAEERREFGHYLLLRELGRGAQGVVFLAEDAQLHRKVALKMLAGAGAPSKAQRDRFQREAELTSKLDHPGICGVYEVGEVDGVPYIAMQYVQGITLAEHLERATKASETVSVAGRGAKSDLEDLVRLIERASRALHVAHEHGLVHRDMKPGNVMVTPDGHPVLLDFGLARDLSGEGQVLTQSGQIVGTPAYLAPEQIVATRGTVDRRTDVYALGVTLFECLTLRRPFDAASWDQLFHQILHGDSANPRKLNPRIPPDLCTVIETAMERDAAHRYPSAEAFADDLRRVRSFEPIHAKAAGPLARLRKWARRKPAYAVGAGAAALFVLAGAASLVVPAIERQRAVKRYLRQAEERLAAGDYEGALEAETRAHERDPESAEALRLKALIEDAIQAAEIDARRQRDARTAAEARDEAAALMARYVDTRRRSDERGAELLRERSGLFSQYAPDDARAVFARQERELEDLRLEGERLLASCEAALQRAARSEMPWGGVGDATLASLADFYVGRWREALASGDAAREAVMRAAVEEHDAAGRYQGELLGRGTLTVEASPEAAELFLFRYESYETVRSGDIVPRLVPVPTAGIGRIEPGAWRAGFHPGDPCFAITRVAAASIAERSGLRPGDLVVRLQDEPIASDAASTPRAWIEGGAPQALRLACLRDGEPLEVEIPAATPSGIGCELTAYPLICSARNRVVSRGPIALDPGSYLLLARTAGFESQRVPVVVDRLTTVAAQVELLPEGSTPSGFVYVPPGEFAAGGDAQAFRPRPLERAFVPGFAIAREEVTNGEWYEFVNDPATLARIDTSKPGTYLPRDDRVMAKPRDDGPGFTWDVYRDTAAETPVLGLAWTDVRDFLEWRNRKAETAGEPWRYDLPSELEWEKAARGVDGRAFPWGDRFDPSLCVCMVRKPGYLLDAPGGFEPMDESPYGVLDMAGSREEWLQDLVPGSQPPGYKKRGGHWLSYAEVQFRAASRADASQDRIGSAQGFRLVARKRAQ